MEGHQVQQLLQNRLPCVDLQERIPPYDPRYFACSSLGYPDNRGDQRLHPLSILREQSGRELLCHVHPVDSPPLPPQIIKPPQAQLSKKIPSLRSISSPKANHLFCTTTVRALCHCEIFHRADVHSFTATCLGVCTLEYRQGELIWKSTPKSMLDTNLWEWVCIGKVWTSFLF